MSFNQSGHGKNDAINAAIAIQCLRENPEWLTWREGREVFKVCRELVRDTAWEEILFPEPESPEVREGKRLLEGYWGEFVIDGLGRGMSYEAIKGTIEARKGET